MPLSSVLIILAMVGYAVYRQTRRYEVVGARRFKLAIVYALVGIAIGGYHVPANATAWTLLVGSIVVSAVVGLARGRATRVWAEGGRVYAQGTARSIALLVGLVVAKVALGVVAYAQGVSDNGGISEVLLMLAVMVALQAEYIWRRAQPLGPRRSRRDETVPA